MRGLDGDYLAHPERHSVLSKVKPGDIRKQIACKSSREPRILRGRSSRISTESSSRPDALESSVVSGVLSEHGL